MLTSYQKHSLGIKQTEQKLISAKQSIIHTNHTIYTMVNPAKTISTTVPEAFLQLNALLHWGNLIGQFTVLYILL